jgi:hypothetical protein
MGGLAGMQLICLGHETMIDAKDQDDWRTIAQKKRDYRSQLPSMTLPWSSGAFGFPDQQQRERRAASNLGNGTVR